MGALVSNKEIESPIKLVSVTVDAEQHMAYVARVSNPKNQIMINLQDYSNTALSMVIGQCLNKHS